MIWQQLDMFAAEAAAPAAPAPAAPAAVEDLDTQLVRRLRQANRRPNVRATHHMLVETATALLAQYRVAPPTGGTPIWADAARKAASRWRFESGRGAIANRLDRLLRAAAPAQTQNQNQ